MRKRVNVEYSKRFLRLLSRVLKYIVDRAQEKEKIFKENPFDSRLDSHIFLNGDEVLFIEIGTHDIYK